MFLNVNGKKVYYEIGGLSSTAGKNKPWMVFVHGWGGSHKSLKKLAHLASRNYATLVFDLPGFGQSDNPDSKWGVKEYADFIVSLFKELGILKPVYFGHSFGGSLGIYIASKNLMPLKSLILCATSFKRTGKKSKTASFVNSVVKKYFPFFEKSMRSIKLLMYKIFFRNSDLARYPHLEPNFRRIVTEDLTPLLGDINTPTFIVWGGRDTYTPVEYADELQLKIPKSQKTVFPHKSHNIPIKYPEDVWKEVKSFLSE